MERLCHRTLLGISRANGPLSQQCFGGYKWQRTLSTTSALRAAKASKASKAKKSAKQLEPLPVNLPKKQPKKKKKNHGPKAPKALFPPQIPAPRKPIHATQESLSTPQPAGGSTPIPKSRPTPKSKPRTNVFKNRIQPIFFGSIALLCFSGGITYAYVMFNKDADPDTKIKTTPAAQEDVSKRYDQIAATFDKTVDSTESWMGLNALREKLASQAVGDVLEVSIGTGRNLEFYSWDFKGFQGVGKVDEKGYIKKGKVRSFTAVDKSGEMLEIAHEKFGKMFPGILGVRWIIADAAEKGAIPGPPKSANERSGSLDKKYDTVVQTMGLCSVNDPVALLKNLGECVKEDEGRILLLEHGRAKWEWLNKYLDKSAQGHADSFGCWWNRDMKSIVEESGLEVVKIERPKWWHGGTTWWIELKKPKSSVVVVEKAKSALAAVMPGKNEEPIVEAAEPKKKGGWGLW